jgi:hypothetical protein
MNPRPCKNCDFSLESISVCCGAWVRSCTYLRLAGISRHVGCQGPNGLVLLTLSSAGVVPYRRFATRLRCSAADAERSCPGTNLGIICDDWSASQTAIPAPSTSTLSAPTKGVLPSGWFQNAEEVSVFTPFRISTAPSSACSGALPIDIGEK